MTGRPRPAWLLPALIAGAATLATVLVLDVVIDDDSGAGGLARQRIASIAPISAQATTSSPSLAPGAITLRSDGLGAVDFGDEPDDVLAVLTGALGTPDEDRAQPCGAGKQARWVRWADLSAVFSTTKFIGFIDGVHYPPGRAPLGLATDAGLMPGDGAERLHQLYADVSVTPEPPQPGRLAAERFTITDAATGANLSGVLEDQGAATIVSTIFAGQLC